MINVKSLGNGKKLVQDTDYKTNKGLLSKIKQFFHREEVLA